MLIKTRSLTRRGILRGVLNAAPSPCRFPPRHVLVKRHRPGRHRQPLPALRHLVLGPRGRSESLTPRTVAR